MSVSSSREVERKFEAADGTPVPDHVGAGFTVEAVDELHLVATYYDTAGLRLLRHGATLRHRTGDDEPGWTEVPGDCVVTATPGQVDVTPLPGSALEIPTNGRIAIS